MITYGHIADLAAEIEQYFYLSGSDAISITLDILGYNRATTLSELRKEVFEYAKRLENS